MFIMQVTFSSAVTTEQLQIQPLYSDQADRQYETLEPLFMVNELIEQSQFLDSIEFECSDDCTEEEYSEKEDEYSEEEEYKKTAAFISQHIQQPKSKYLTQFIQRSLPDRTEILEVYGPDKILNFPTALFIIFLSVFLSSAMYIYLLIEGSLNQQAFKSFLKATKDVMFALPLVMICLLFNYILSDEQKSQINFLGVLDYIDIDKLLIQIAAFVSIWMMVGIFFIFISQIQYSEWKKLETYRIQKKQVYRQYEQLHMNNQNAPEYQEVKKRVQYLVLRQMFICPTFQPPFVAQYLREDFDFPLFLLKASETVYFSMMRITLVIFFLFLIVCLGYSYSRYYISEYLGIIVNPLYPLICVPYFITMLLQWFQHNHQLIFENLVHRVDSPYDFRLVEQSVKKDPMNLRDAVPMPKYIQMNFQPNKQAGRSLSLFIFKTKQAQIVILHGIVFLQVLWFVLFFFTALIPGSVFYYTVVAVSAGIGVVNLFIFVPNIVGLIAINNNMHGMRSRKLVNKVAMVQQLKQFQYMEKVSCQLKGQLYKLIKQQDQNKSLRESVIGQQSELFSLTAIQKDILKHAFLRVAQSKKNIELMDEEQQPENDISEDTSIDITDLHYIAQICGGRMEFWYMMILSNTYFKGDKKIKFSDLVEYAGYNQKIIELGVRPFISQMLQIKFEQKKQITLEEFIEMISSDPVFTEQEVEYLVFNMQCLNPDDHYISLENFINFIVDATSQFLQ